MAHHIHHHGHMHHHAKREDQHLNSGASLPSYIDMLEERATRVHLVPRASCTNDTDSGCVKPTQVPTLPIILGVVIPVVGLAIVLFILHRRNRRKLREEDANDKYKSLDFGLGSGQHGAKAAKKSPEMSYADAEKSIRGAGPVDPQHARGISMDVLGSPYILPAAVHGSRESLHSLSRSTHDPHDPYRPVTFLNKENGSIRSGRSRPYRPDNASTYTSSTGEAENHRMGDSLIKNAQRMSQSIPPRAESLSPQETHMPEIKFPEPAASRSVSPRYENAVLPPPPPPPVAQPEVKSEYAAFKPADAPLPSVAVQASSPDPNIPPVRDARSPIPNSPSPPLYPRVQSQEASVVLANTSSIISTSSYGDGVQVTPASPPQRNASLAQDQEPVAPVPTRRPVPNNNGLGVEGFNTNRLSMSLRPLPPDDPNDNPEQRANRIRSFYKEYFDDSKPEPVGGHTYTDYYEDYGSEFQDGTVFDPHSGTFVISQGGPSFAQPVTRRAMTPPPRAPPRFRSGSNSGPRGPHFSNGSMASSPRFQIPPRGMSSMSGRLPQPRKPMPPPSALNSLPTPARITEDSMFINPADFAPPVSFRERQNGMRPDSPLGAPRPYSPSVRAHTPLASSFDDLAVIPSPHALRKSGTYTSLDFAPPPRFRDPGSNASDAGSIRSNRSGLSSAGRMAVRNGAYRVSKIPREMVGTQDDMMASLKPKFNMVTPA